MLYTFNGLLPAGANRNYETIDGLVFSFILSVREQTYATQ